MKQFVVSPAAELDLDDIWDYSAENWSPRQAERYICMIQDTITGLTDGSQPSQTASHIRAGYRRAWVGMHVLFFKESDEVVDVIRILHQRMDPTLHLRS